MTDINYVGDTAEVTLDGYPGYRFNVRHDIDAPDPVEDSGAPVELWVIASGYGSIREGADHGDWTRLFREFIGSLGDENKALEAVRRYAVIWYGWEPERAAEAFTVYTNRGPAQSDWSRMFVAVTEEDYGTAIGWAREWSDWSNGNVWEVQAERYDDCGYADCHAPDWTHWIEWDEDMNDLLPCGGFYAGDQVEAAKQYADDHMGA